MSMTQYKRITIIRPRKSLQAEDRQHLPLTALLPYNPRSFTEGQTASAMIKILRFANEKYPWFLAVTMGFIAVTFIVGMGWWGFGEHAGSAVATVGDLSVSTDEFKRAYENTYRFYKDKVPGEFKDETIKQYVVEQLIDNRVWLIAAHNMGLTVSDDDLRESIVQIPEFHKNGRFDPEHYQRLLAANHLTPS